jgi:phosphate-selective porin OprO and OprP
MTRWGLLLAVLVGGAAPASGTEPPALPSNAPIMGALPDTPSAPPTAVPPNPPSTSNPLAERLNLVPTFELRGRIEVDAVMAAQSAASKAQIGDLQNGYGFRRARLGAQGTVGTSARWVAEIDFANGNFRPRDLYVGLTALPGVREVRVGYFREPFSLEGLTSSRFITFLERSPLNQFDPTRNWGLAGYWWPDNERATFAIGVYRDGTNNGGFSSGDGDTWAVTTRATALPVYEDAEGVFRLVHIGAAFSYRDPLNGVVKYAANVQSNLLDVSDNAVSPFLPTINVPANSQQLYNLQGAVVFGPLSIQGEWFGNAIQQTNGGLVFLHGFYLYGSYFLTGEHRGYDRTEGAFGRVAVRRPLVRSTGAPATGFGAIELAARFAVLDAVSGNLPPTPGALAPNGAVLYQTTLGANWYLNSYTRLMFNYTVAVPTASGQPALPVHLFGLRTAIDW